MLTFPGAAALSDFRLDKALGTIRERVAHVEAIDTRYLHFVETRAPLTADATSVLQALLHYGPSRDAGEPRGETLIVVPRFDTVSPWSSKATDIAHVCGLADVVRIALTNREPARIGWRHGSRSAVASSVERSPRAKEKSRLARKSRPAFFSPFLEREKGFEPSTSTLARWHSTTELLPRNFWPLTYRTAATLSRRGSSREAKWGRKIFTSSSRA